MFATAQRGINAYATVGIETDVESADPHKLILMLFDGALCALIDAKRFMSEHDVAAKGRAISKAIAIIESGLRASLDLKAGGRLSERLAMLYEYMCARLLAANLHNKPELIDEVSRLLGELRGAWAQIRPQAGAAQADAGMTALAAAAYRKV